MTKIYRWKKSVKKTLTMSLRSSGDSSVEKHLSNNSSGGSNNSSGGSNNYGSNNYTGDNSTGDNSTENAIILSKTVKKGIIKNNTIKSTNRMITYQTKRLQIINCFLSQAKVPLFHYVQKEMIKMYAVADYQEYCLDMKKLSKEIDKSFDDFHTMAKKKNWKKKTYIDKDQEEIVKSFDTTLNTLAYMRDVGYLQSFDSIENAFN